MKVRITKGDEWYRDRVGETFEVEDISLIYFCLKEDRGYWILKKDAEIVDEDTKSCSNCSREYNCCEDREYCNTKGFVYWEPIKKVIESAEIVINKQGGKQSKIATAFSLVPHESLLTVARVMKIGSERYEKDNWRRLSADEIYDHLMEHLVNWHISGDMEELSHAVTRAMMLYEVANNGN